MEREEILSRLKGVLAAIKPKLDVDKIGFDSSLTTDLGLDSLSMLLTGLAVEKEFGIKFEPNIPPATMSDVVEYIMLNFK